METTAPSSGGRLPCYWSPIITVVIVVLLLPPSPSSLHLPLSATNSPPAHYYSFSTVSEVAVDTVGVDALTASLSSSSLGPPPSPADRTTSEGEREERMEDQRTTECRTCFVDVSVMHMISLSCCGHEICEVCVPGWFGKAREVDAMDKPTNNNNCPHCREPICSVWRIRYPNYEVIYLQVRPGLTMD